MTVIAFAAAPGRLILLRHGQSSWNLQNRFTGWEDVPLTPLGEEEALQAADLLLSDAPDIVVDVVYTSVLQRAVRTAELFVERCAAAHSRPLPIRTRWRLNERHYGVLQGLDKAETLERWPDRKALSEWRLSFAGAPPPMTSAHPFYSRSPARLAQLRAATAASDGGEALRECDVPLTESIADTVVRVRPLWHDEILPTLLGGQTCVVVGHANCMRALVSCIQGNIDDESLPTLGLPNAIPLVYELDREGAPIRGLEARCYVPPLMAYYLGEACDVFNRLDSDGSGALDAAELAELDACRVSFEALDEDGDELLSADEVAAACGDVLLAQADGNGDGLVNFQEWMNWWARQKQKPKT